MLRTNRFPAHCSTCRRELDVGQGFYDPDQRPRRMYCAAHSNEPAPSEPEQRVPTERLTMSQDLIEDPIPAKQAPAPDFDQVLARLVKLTGEHYTQTVPALVAQEFARLAPRSLEIKVGSQPKVHIDQHHKALPTVLQAVAAGVNVFLVGPAGSGKTTLAEQVAQALKRPFYYASRVTSEYKLTGFTDATGNVVRTSFREAYEHGGVFLLDEIDACDPDVMTAFNAPIANGSADFPDGMIKKHPKFIAIAAGNTFGRGADRQYVGRNQLDAATLDRFATIEVDYDEVFELALAGNPEWTRYVQKVRKAVETERVRHIVSPRASIEGAKLLAAGMERAIVEEATVWKGLPSDVRQRVQARAGAY